MKQRIITAVVAAGIFLPIVVYGQFPLVLLIYLIATIGLHELLRMRKLSIFSIPGAISIFLLWIFLLPKEYIHLLEQFRYSKIEVALMGVLLFLTYTVISKNRFTFDDVAYSMLSALYVGIGFYYFIETRIEGLTYIFFALFIIWATDSGAYFVGRAFGKHKLWPEISPKKTVEGSIGGILSALLIAFIFSMFSDWNVPALQLYGTTAILSIFGQIGDLVESALKRHYGVKDSGNLLPGHGGILDRFDSLLFVLPIMHFMHFV
ncbi:MAG: phosphatidate cytidylyltransferase [Bacillus sp. (in: Bacteria)]|nr:phosphatidate cytidylyltransferase [Bacillus sp. (in: firmicutes)]